MDTHLLSPLAQAPNVAGYIFTQTELEELVGKWRETLKFERLFPGFPEEYRWPPPYVVHPMLIDMVVAEKLPVSSLASWMQDWWYIPVMRFERAVIQKVIPPTVAHKVLQAIPSEVTIYHPMTEAWQTVEKYMKKLQLGAAVGIGAGLLALLAMKG